MRAYIVAPGCVHINMRNADHIFQAASAAAEKALDDQARLIEAGRSSNSVCVLSLSAHAFESARHWRVDIHGNGLANPAGGVAGAPAFYCVCVCVCVSSHLS
jgi:hypothetical protein